MKTYDELTNDILEKAKNEKSRRTRLARRITSAALAIVLVLGGVITAHFVSRAPSLPATADEQRSDMATEQIKAPESETGRQTLSANSDYKAIFANLNQNREYEDNDYSYNGSIREVNEAQLEAGETRAAVEGETRAPAGAEKADDASPSDVKGNVADEAEHSETNVQVNGVDEADVVKTDGKYIYAVSRQNIYIYSADNGKMTLEAKVALLNSDGTLITNSDDGKALRSFNSAELYFTDDRLIVVCGAQEVSTDKKELDYDGDGKTDYYDDFVYFYGRHSYQCASIYDISDLSNVSLLKTIAVSGSGISSRMIGDRLYLCASDEYYGILDENDPETFIPSIYENGETKLVESSTVYCGEDKTDCIYLNVLEVNADDASVASSLSLLGYNGDIMYQSADNIYVARTVYDSNYSPVEENGILTETYYDTRSTVITKISVANGLELVASAALEGYLNNSFSMDEYDGYLRVVTSVRKWSYEAKWRTDGSGEAQSGYFETAIGYDPTVPDDTEVISSAAEYDEAEPIETEIFDDPQDYNAVKVPYNDEPYYNYYYNGYIYESTDSNEMYNDLFILDGSLNVVGSLTGIAEDERIYSCRFEGDQGYFVTYRETDPLFHVDLSDPTAPKIVGELKLPGYSDYLQRYGDLLLGFGVSENGFLKVSMFSENEDGSMDEIATTEIPNAIYSEAMYDHHAILADAKKNVICFGASVWYDSYTADDGYYTDYYNGVEYFILSYGEDGFKIENSFEIGEGWPEQLRGFYIGDFFYIYQNSYWDISAITSYDLLTFVQVDRVTMDEGDIREDYYPYVIVE